MQDLNKHWKIGKMQKESFLYYGNQTVHFFSKQSFGLTFEILYTMLIKEIPLLQQTIFVQKVDFNIPYLFYICKIPPTLISKK